MHVWPLAAKMPRHHAVHCIVEIGVGEDDVGGFAAHLQRHLTLRFAASEAIAWPVAVEPVNAIFAMPGCATSAAPALGPPVTTLTTPSGMPASRMRSASRSVEVGVTSDGLITTVLPAARAGNSFQPRRPSGVFHGVIAATTPIGFAQGEGREIGARRRDRGA